MFGDNKPSGLEAMVAKMIGISPAQMAEAFTGLQATIIAVGEALKRIEETQRVILAKVERLEHVGSNGNDNNSGGDAGRGTSDGDAGQRNGTAVAIEYRGGGTAVGNDGG